MKNNTLVKKIKVIAENIEYYKRHIVDPEKYLCKIYKRRMGKELNLKNPKTYNEKLQWIKLYNHNPLYTKLVDKYGVKDYVTEKIGAQYVIPTLGVWDNFEKIDFSTLPNQFVLKCTHDSGGVVICKNKSSFNIKEASKKIKKNLKYNYYYMGFEWPYKNVPRKIIAEKYIQDSSEAEGLTDYKFFCFNGYVDCVMVAIERHTGNPKFYFFDKEWKLLKYNKRGKEAEENFTLPKPKLMSKMFEIAGKLSQGLPCSRIDLYSCEGKIYFGEITFFSDSGFDVDILPETDKIFGDLIEIENLKGE